LGLTEKGYVRRTYDDILTDKINKAKELFGEDIDTSDLTPLGKYIRLNAFDQAMAEEEIEAVYYARFVDTAAGQSLDRLLIFGGLSRNMAEAAAYSVQFTGETGFAIPAGTLVGTDTELTFATVEETAIGDNGTCTADVVCTQAGSIGNVNPGAINALVNPDANIGAVKGLECLSVGVDEESDTDLRMRFKTAVAGAGSCSANAIRAALLRVPTVQFADVIENDTEETDKDGRPPHSFECYVLGGSDYEQEIAETIFDKRPPGIRTVGSKAVTITADNGAEKIVRYSTALNVLVSVRAQIRTDVTFPADGAAQVQANVSAYINSLGIGKALVLNTIYKYIYAVPGVVECTSLELSSDGGSTYSEANVYVPQYGVAVSSGVSVEVSAE